MPPVTDAARPTAARRTPRCKACVPRARASTAARCACWPGRCAPGLPLPSPSTTATAAAFAATLLTSTAHQMADVHTPHASCHVLLHVHLRQVHDQLSSSGLPCNLVTGQERRDLGAPHTACTTEMASTQRVLDVAVSEHSPGRKGIDPQRRGASMRVDVVLSGPWVGRGGGGEDACGARMQEGGGGGSGPAQACAAARPARNARRAQMQQDAHTFGGSSAPLAGAG